MTRILTEQRTIFASELARLIVQNRLLVVSQDSSDGEPMVLVAQELRKLGIHLRCKHVGRCCFIILEDLSPSAAQGMVVISGNDNRHLLIGDNAEHVGHRNDEQDWE